MRYVCYVAFSSASNFRRSDGEQTNDANAFLSTITAFNPTSRVRADIFFRDNGTGSTAAGPQTQRCLPPTPNTLTFNQMVLGYWQPVNSSVRTLVAVKTGTSNAPADYAPLSSFASTSVRLDTQFGQPLTVNPSPARYVLQACGAVRPTRSDD